MQQTDARLPNRIKRYGCYYMVLGRMVEIDTGHTFTADEIIITLEICESKKYILENCKIQNPDGVLKILYQIANSSKKILQIGSIVYGKVEYWGWVIDKAYDFVIRKYSTKNGNHFMLLNIGKGIEYNPDESVITFDVEMDILYKKII